MTIQDSSNDAPRLRKVILAFAVGGVCSVSVAAFAQSGPTQQQLQAAGSDSANWVLPGRTYANNRYVRESQITTSNVRNLKVAWTFKIPDSTTIEAVPTVWDNTVYIPSGHDNIYALDSETGKVKWKYEPNVKQTIGFARNKGVAVFDGKVFEATIGCHLTALDAKTGKVIWDKLECHNPKNSFYSMAPVPYKGLLLVGVSNGDWGGVGNISAFDANTGNRVWQWDSIPKPGEPGNETWSGDSWKRGGGAMWTGLAIDPKTGTMYVDVGNPQPDFLGTYREGKNLYTDSLVAVDISGSKPKVKWYYQFTPHDTHDWDPTMPPVLFTANVDGRQQDLVASGDKAGNLWVLDAESGKLVYHTPISYQYHHDLVAGAGDGIACPNTNGGTEWAGGAYDPVTNAFFVASTNQCGKFTANSKAVYIAGQFYLGGGFPKLIGPNWGWLNAVSLDTGVFNWRHYYPVPNAAGVLIMGDSSDSVVFAGELDGNFDAFDAKTGERLWNDDTGASIMAAPTTYVRDGKRYVVVASGQPGLLKVPELTIKEGPAVLTAFVQQASN